jgi:hypothetical protein
MPRISFKLSELMVLLTIIAMCLAISAQWPFVGIMLCLGAPPAFVCEVLAKRKMSDRDHRRPIWKRAAHLAATSVTFSMLAYLAMCAGNLVFVFGEVLFPSFSARPIAMLAILSAISLYGYIFLIYSKWICSS